MFRAISAAREMYGHSAIGLFIISMTQGADDVLTALALCRDRQSGKRRAIEAGCGAAAGDSR